MIGIFLWGLLGVFISGRMIEVNILLYFCGVVINFRILKWFMEVT